MREAAAPRTRRRRAERAAPSQVIVFRSPQGAHTRPESDFERRMVSKVWTRVADSVKFGGLGLLSAGRDRPAGPPRFGKQVPQHAADDQASAREHEDVERLAVKHPADQRDQRHAQEIERNDHGRVAGAERVGQAIVRRQAGDPERERRAQQIGAETEDEQRRPPVAAPRQAAPSATASRSSRR